MATITQEVSAGESSEGAVPARFSPLSLDVAQKFDLSAGAAIEIRTSVSCEVHEMKY